MRKPWMLLVLVGCTTEKTSWEPILDAVDAGDGAEVVIAGGVGTGVVDVPVILVNELGIAVPSDGAADLRVEGASAALVSSSVDFGASGHGIAQVTTAGPERFTLAVTGTSAGVGGGAEGTGYAVSSGLPSFQLDHGAVTPEDIEDPDFVRAGTGGSAVGRGSEIWWVPTGAGQPAWRVAALPLDEPVRGMWSTHLDGDGVLDLVVWNSSTAFALRGRAGGGYTWGAAWTPTSGTVAGIAVADLNGDQLADLAIANTGEVAGGVEILDGDGAWGFTASSVLELDFPLWGVAATDEGRDGRADISVLSEITGSVRRYTLADEGWVGGTWPEIDVAATEGTVLWPMTDVDNNGTEDLILVGPPASSQDLTFYTMGDDVTRWSDPYSSFDLAIADMDGTAPEEMVFVEAGSLTVLRSTGSTGDPNFTRGSHKTTTEVGPLSVVDYNDDDVLDAGLFTTDLRWLSGAIGEDGAWDTVSWGYRSYSVSLSGPVLYDDFDGDGLLDMLSLDDDDGAVVLTVRNFVVEDGETTPRKGDDLTIDGDSTAESLAACTEGGDTIVYAISSNGSTYHLNRFRLDASSALTAEASTPVSGSMVVCGDFDPGSAAVVGTSGAWTAYEYTGGALETSGETGDIGSVIAVAAADTDGDGTTEVVGCTDTGCNVVAADLDADGDDEVVTGGTAISVLDGEESQTVDGSGQVTVVDADADGHDDILALQMPADPEDTEASRRIYLLRGVSGGVAPALLWHTTRELHGPIALGDVTGDGVPELVAEGSGSSVVHTDASTAAE